MQMVGHRTEAIYRRYAFVSEADLVAGGEKLTSPSNPGLHRALDHPVPAIALAHSWHNLDSVAHRSALHLLNKCLILNGAGRGDRTVMEALKWLWRAECCSRRSSTPYRRMGANGLGASRSLGAVGASEASSRSHSRNGCPRRPRPPF
jgi:hypothetical protein